MLASRAEDSQHTFVTVPVIRTVSIPRRVNSSGSARRPGKESAGRGLLDQHIVVVDLNSRQTRSAGAPCRARLNRVSKFVGVVMWVLQGEIVVKYLKETKGRSLTEMGR
ncbi:hypothetical protein [Saccharopolyspora sp. ASAGF58]|uniref:hypothetical protein n=1 Tax=Saccharopolyspora sp. ASAGF58 TaxID=2719023 RepID=UPI001B31533E|nr:hypothetical protein [Saccharopolyspora sp. ASAGF58]